MEIFHDHYYGTVCMETAPGAPDGQKVFNSRLHKGVKLLVTAQTKTHIHIHFFSFKQHIVMPQTISLHDMNK